MKLLLGHGDTHPFAKVDLTDRSSVQELLKTFLEPLEPFFSPQKARVNCPGGTAVRFDHAASELEGFARPLWGLAFLLAGDVEFRGTEWWIQGIKAGTDPENPEYWGFPVDNDQRMVEMCPLGKQNLDGHNGHTDGFRSGHPLTMCRLRSRRSACTVD